MELGALPALAGAVEVLGRGITSSLEPQNARAAAWCAGAEPASSSAKWSLALDPQTGTPSVFTFALQLYVFV